VNGLQVYVMCELPSNVDRKLRPSLNGLTAFSIGSNDLTQLTLGLDSRFSSGGRSLREASPIVKDIVPEWRSAQPRRCGRKIGILRPGPERLSRVWARFLAWSKASDSIQP